MILKFSEKLEMCASKPLSEQAQLTKAIYDEPFISHSFNEAIELIKNQGEHYFCPSDNVDAKEKLEAEGFRSRAYHIYMLQYQSGEFRLALIPTLTNNTWHQSKKRALDKALENPISITSNREKECYDYEVKEDLSTSDFPKPEQEQIDKILDKLTKEHYIETIDDAIKLGLIKTTDEEENPDKPDLDSDDSKVTKDDDMEFDDLADFDIDMDVDSSIDATTGMDDDFSNLFK